MEINNDTDNSSTIKKIYVSFCIWLCNVCIFRCEEQALISHNIPKQIMIFPVSIVSGEARCYASFCLLFTPRYVHSFQ